MRLPVEARHEVGDFSRPTFLTGLPSLGTCSVKFVVAFGRLAMPVNSVSQLMVVERQEVGIARNLIAEHLLTLTPRPRYLFFIGDDMLPQWDGLLKLWEEMESQRWDVLAGLYHMKSEPPIPVAWRLAKPGPLKLGVDWQPGEVIPVDVVGMDFTLIRPEVFERLGAGPWFKTGITWKEHGWPFPEGMGSIKKHTEDVWFCDRVREAGMRVGLHTGVRVAHYNNVDGMVY